MATQTSPKTGFEKWQDGIDKADATWDSWDCEIQMAVNEYNHHLSGTPGYISLDWKFIKAMIWSETGPHRTDWNFKPMQIGVADDPGMTSFLLGNEGGDLILPPTWEGRLTLGSVTTIPAHNIRAGIGYLLMRMADFEYRNQLGANSKIYEVTVKRGDSLDRIARIEGSTVKTLRYLNQGISDILKPGQVLRCQKASIQRVITGWKRIDATSIANYYNGKRDPNYAKKIDYALSVMHNKGRVALCAQ